MLRPHSDEEETEKGVFKFGACQAHKLNPKSSSNQLCHTVAVCVLIVHVYVCVLTYQTDS